MSLHCAFLFPQNEFHLILDSTIGFVSDNMFYRQNFQTNTTEVEQNPRGRSYQCMAANHKRGLVALADYGNNPVIEIRSVHNLKNAQPSSARSISFELTDICKLQIHSMEFSIDCKYLYVCCGIPEQELIVIDLKKRKRLSAFPSKSIRGISSEERAISADSSIKIDQNCPVKKIRINPGNEKIFAVMFETSIQIYEVIDNFVVQGKDKSVDEGIRIIKIQSIPLEENSTYFENMIWDEINNLYISDGHYLRIYSTDTKNQVMQYELEGDFESQAICSLVLTLKHIIVFYSSGRIEWLKKYYPDAMEEEDPKERPLYLQKYYEFTKRKIKYALYNHFFDKIIISHTNGFYSIIQREAESNQIEDEDEQNNKKIEQNSSKRENKDLKGDLQINEVGPFFSSQTNNQNDKKVIMCRQIKGTCLLFTVSGAGRIIVWSAIQRDPSVHIDLGIRVLSADINDDSSVLAVSCVNGIIQFYNIMNLEKIYLFKQYRLLQQNEGEITEICFSSNSKELACLNPHQKRIFYVLTDIKANQFQVLGYCTLPYKPISISWHKSQKSVIKAKYEHLIVNIQFGVILINSPSPNPAPLSSNPTTQIKGIDIYACRTDPKQKLVFSTFNNGDLLTTGDDLYFKKYKLPEDSLSKFNPQAKVAIPAPIQEIEAHDLEVAYVGRGKNGEIITGGRDGIIQIRNADFAGEIVSFSAHGWRYGNLVACQGSQTSGLYYSCGKDGIVCMWKTRELQIELSDKLPTQSSENLKKIESQKQGLEYYVRVMQQDYLQKMKEKITEKKKSQLDKIAQIKIELKQLLTENQSHEELERLERDQFAIDLESREVALKIGDEKCDKIKKESQQKVLHEEVYRKKLKQITWDMMEEHLKAINGLKNNYIVFNYQIRKQSKQERRELNMIMDLRRLQIKEEKKKKNKLINSQFYANKNIINGGILQPLILTIFQKKDEKKDDKTKKKKQDQANQQPEELQQIPNQEIWQLLYSSFELYSNNSKANQVILMQNIIFKIKQNFNKEFNKMMKMRQSQNELINDKNKRIIEICEELKRANQTILTNKNILENPDTILQVHPNQIPFARYLSREERQKLEQERLKEEERLRKLAEDDSSQRALGKMMGGTLEEKKTSVLEVIVEKQKWMDKPIQQMTEQEKAKFKEYEQKKQKAQEQKERIVKKLEAELRKLKQQIDELMEKYDEKLFMLLRRRIEYDLRIQEQELYCIKLSLSAINASEYTEKEKELQRKKEVFTNRYNALIDYRDELINYEENLERLKAQKRAVLDAKKQADIQTKIKTVEKSVFEEYNTNLKKRREMEEKIIESGDKLAKYQIVKLDPMKQIQSKLLSQRNALSFRFFLPQIQELQQTYEFPDSLIHTLETRFNIKKQEHQYDQKLKAIKETISQIEQDLGEEKVEQDKDLEELQQIKRYLQQQRSDLEVQCRIKKGQVQIDNDAPVPKLEDALLINIKQIEEKNRNIVGKAELKISVMGEIKKAKIRVTEDSLNLERKQMLIDELSNMIKEIQMLKVKKEMQVALSKKDTKINENQIRSLKEQIEKVRKQGEKRMGILQKKIDKVLQEIETIKRENKQLEVQKYNLDNTVKQREKIKEMMVGENGGSNQEAAQKFDQISINRKLFDKAKQQTQEIELLREELSKLKAKTFANFSNVQR